MLLRFALVFCLSIGIALSVFSQDERSKLSIFINRLQLSTGIGAWSYYGDLGGLQPGSAKPFLIDFTPQSTRFGFQVAPRYKYNSWISQKVFLNAGWLSGNDAFSGNGGRRKRNLRFDAPIVQFGTIVELYFLPDKTILKQNAILPKRVRRYFAYVFGGVSGMYFNPMASGLGKIYSLPALATEGTAYSTFTTAFPVGIGLEYLWKKKWNIGFEAGYVFTLTDYLDDVSGRYPDFSQMSRQESIYFSGGTRIGGYPAPGSKRGNPANKDGYFFFSVNFIYKFSDTKNPSAGVFCPTFAAQKIKRSEKLKEDPVKLGSEYSKTKGNLNIKEGGQVKRATKRFLKKEKSKESN
jgi:hypothetical protein